jgi:ABC-type sugar transport system ATPase subunit
MKLRVSSLQKHYGGIQALKGVSFDVAQGEVHALVGENGAGKSTLLKILCGSVTPDGGSVELDGELVRTFTPEHAQGRGIGMVYQELNLVTNLSVAENLFLGRYPRSRLGIIDRRRMEREASALLSEYGVSLDPKAKLASLGTGQRQLLEVLRAVHRRARLLLLDEPTSALSKAEIDLLFHRVLARMKAQGVAIIYVSHRLEEVFAIADRISVLRDGERVATGQRAALTEDEVIRCMVGRDITQRYVKHEVPIGQVTLEVKGLSAKKAIHDCSLHVRKGEIVGIAGLMGSGRTELAKAIVGLLPREAGEIRRDGARVEVRTPHDAVRAGISYLSESRRESVLGRLSIAKNITLGKLAKVFPGGVLRPRLEQAAANGFFKSLGIAAVSIYQRVASLSGGNQQKVVLARLMFSDADVFLLDEPTMGIDVGAKIEVYDLIGDLVRAGKAVVLISSELPEVVALSDRVYVMSRGRIAGEFVRRNVTQEDIMRVATGGRAQ